MNSPSNTVFLIFFLYPFTFFGEILSINPIPAGELLEINKKYSELERIASLRIQENPNDISSFSSRGDARLFLGKFMDSRNDYEKMIELNPQLEVSHWRLGIAYFYLSDFSKAARQFEIYHKYDNVDRENGIWRFMSQYKEKGIEYARNGLLIYTQDDRPPYPWLYEMFTGDIKSGEVFKRIKSKAFSTNYETRVLFHADLYVGIFFELTEGPSSKALFHLARAASSEYGRQSGTFMWQVARLHHARLAKTISKLKD